MKISFRTEYGTENYNHSIDLPGYWNMNELNKDLDKVLEFYQLKYNKWKQEYIKDNGQEAFDKRIEGNK